MTHDRIIPRSPCWNNDRRYFYKYLSLEAAKSVIATRKLRFSRPALLNDPFDMGFDLPLPIKADALKPKIIDAMWEANFGDLPPPPANMLGFLIALYRGRMPRMSREEFEAEFGDTVDESLLKMGDLTKFHEEIRGFMATTKVLCLTESPNNVLMWAHYAQAHTGVVLRLRSIPEKDSIFGIAKPVRYLDEMPALMNDDEIVALLSGSGRGITDAGLMDKLVYTKSADWKYEQEWRIAAGEGWSKEDIFEDVLFGPDELDGIIFGTKTPVEERNTIIGLARAQNQAVALFEVKRSPEAFAFEVIELAGH